MPLQAALQTAGHTTDLRAGLLPDGPGAAAELVAGFDELILAPFAEPEWLDGCSRRVYDLLAAARSGTVCRALIISTMELFRAYPQDYVVRLTAGLTLSLHRGVRGGRTLGGGTHGGRC